MPNRIIREGFLDSEPINSMNDFNQLMFVRLLLVVDDYGRIDARPELLRSKCFPISDRRLSDISQSITELASKELIFLYEVDCKQYLEIKEFRQRLRVMKSRYPAPSDGQLSDRCLTTVGVNPNLNPNIEVEERKINTGTKSQFKKPTIQEISDYCKERKNNIDAESFFDYYESRGWFVGKYKMKNWQAAIRTWEKNNFNSGKNGKQSFEKNLDNKYSNLKMETFENDK